SINSGTNCPAWRSSAATSKPLFPGSITSRTTMSKCRLDERSKASAVSPSPETSTLYPSASRLKRSPSARCFSSSTINTVGIVLGPRKHDCEGAPHPLAGAFGENATAVPFDNGAHDEEPEPGALHVRHDACGDAVEPPEDALELSARDANTAVGDADGQALCVEW